LPELTDLTENKYWKTQIENTDFVDKTKDIYNTKPFNNKI
jgi:hypothetical protein